MKMNETKDTRDSTIYVCPVGIPFVCTLATHTHTHTFGQTNTQSIYDGHYVYLV